MNSTSQSKDLVNSHLEWLSQSAEVLMSHNLMEPLLLL